MKKRVYVVEWCGHAIHNGEYSTKKEAEVRLAKCSKHRLYGGYSIREKQAP